MDKRQTYRRTNKRFCLLIFFLLKTSVKGFFIVGLSIFVVTMKKIGSIAWSIIKNYYVMATLGFIVWVGFFDSDNLLGQYAQRKVMNGLIEQKKFYTEEIQNMKKLSEALTNDKEALEKYGRENYLMKRPSEDIFLIVSEDSVKGKE
jgi:cell division protein DivIC